MAFSTAAARAGSSTSVLNCASSGLSASSAFFKIEPNSAWLSSGVGAPSGRNPSLNVSGIRFRSASRSAIDSDRGSEAATL